MRLPILMGFLLFGLSQFVMAHSSEPFSEKSEVDRFFKDHALVFFFSSQCTYCQQFAPIVNLWAKSRGTDVLALSFDNQALAAFPDWRPVTTEWVNAAYEGKPISYPALFIANREHLLYQVAYGAMGYEALELRFQQIKGKIEAYEARRKPV